MQGFQIPSQIDNFTFILSVSQINKYNFIYFVQPQGIQTKKNYRIGLVFSQGVTYSKWFFSW